MVGDAAGTQQECATVESRMDAELSLAVKELVGDVCVFQHGPVIPNQTLLCGASRLIRPSAAQYRPRLETRCRSIRVAAQPPVRVPACNRFPVIGCPAGKTGMPDQINFAGDLNVTGDP